MPPYHLLPRIVLLNEAPVLPPCRGFFASLDNAQPYRYPYLRPFSATGIEAKDAAWALVEALNANGIETLLDADHDNPNPTNRIDINVGIRP
jgi:hypothetical protein